MFQLDASTLRHIATIPAGVVAYPAGGVCMEPLFIIYISLDGGSSDASQ